jgi:hypothetical protein
MSASTSVAIAHTPGALCWIGARGFPDVDAAAANFPQNVVHQLRDPGGSKQAG